MGIIVVVVAIIEEFRVVLSTQVVDLKFGWNREPPPGS